MRGVRRFRGLTQEALAEQLEVTSRYLAGVERGKRNLGTAEGRV
ncbi:helix-turn-helix domain-containing protein [Microbacterium sp. NPDC091676]